MTSLPLSRSDLEAATRRGERFKYLCFWGHSKPSDGSVVETFALMAVRGQLEKA